MKTRDYKKFWARVAEANERDEIWWNGTLWLALTEKQCKDIIALLRVHPSVIREGNNLRLPSSITIQINW